MKQDEDNLDLDLDNDSFDDDSFNDAMGFDGMGGGESPMSKHSDLLKELTNFDPGIRERIKNWLGLEYDSELKDYKKTENAIINEKGARWAIGWLKIYMAKSNFITNISNREFKNLQLDINQICWLVFPTRDDFGVQSNSDWYRLCNELHNSAFLVLAGAGDGKYTRFLGETVTRHENVTMSPDKPMRQMAQQKPGFLEGTKNLLLGKQ